MDESKNKKNKASKVSSIIILTCSMLYAIVRYVFFGDAAFSQIPAYVANKALAISAVIYFLLVALYYFNGNETKAKDYARSGMYLITLHILISLSLFSKDYYPKFYGINKLNLNGEMILSSGAIALLLFWNQNKALIFRLLMLMFVAIHLFFMGYQEWTSLEKWNGGMPPISLIGFLAAISGIIIWGINIQRDPKDINFVSRNLEDL